MSPLFIMPPSFYAFFPLNTYLSFISSFPVLRSSDRSCLPIHLSRLCPPLIRERKIDVEMKNLLVKTDKLYKKLYKNCRVFYFSKFLGSAMIENRQIKKKAKK